MSKARDLADILASGSILSDGVISTTEIDGITATAAELNKLDGVTATTAELNYVDGVTSSIQTQLDAKGAGTVTSVGGTGSVQGLTLSGTVTSSGNLTLGGSLSDVNLTSQVTGTLPVSSGGTGSTSLTANNVILGNGTSAVQAVAPGTSGNILTSNGSTWQSTAPAGGGGNWEHSLTTTASDVTSVSFTLSGGSLYAVVVKDMRGEHSGFGNLSVKFGNLTSSLYGYSYTTSTGGLEAAQNNQAQSRLATGRVGSDSSSMYGHLNGIVYINPGGGSQFPAMWYNGSMMNQDQRAQNVSGAGSYASDSSTGTSAVLFNSAGNISGTFIFYKITV